MLDRLAPNKGAKKARRRVGRGKGSGTGKTSGRGHKGAGARSGRKRRPWMEGGQMAYARRLPKFGFHNLFRREFQVVNVKDLGKFEKGTVVDPAALSAAGLVGRADAPVKILAEGEMAQALTLKVDAVSAGARQKIEAVGGSIEILPKRREKKSEVAES